MAFEHPFTFQVSDGWTNTRDGTHGGEISRALSGGFAWVSGVSAGQVEDKLVQIGPRPPDFIDYLGSNPGLTVGQPQTTTIDGVPGQWLDVTVNADTPGVLLVDDDAFNLGKGEKVRYYVLDKDGSTVILFLWVRQDGDFDGFVELTKPILDSIRW